MKVLLSDPPPYARMGNTLLQELVEEHVDGIIDSGSKCFENLCDTVQENFKSAEEQSNPCGFTGFLSESEDSAGKQDQHEYLRKLKELSTGS